MNAILNSQKPVTFIEQKHCGFTFVILLEPRMESKVSNILGFCLFRAILSMIKLSVLNFSEI